MDQIDLDNLDLTTSDLADADLATGAATDPPGPAVAPAQAYWPSGLGYLSHTTKTTIRVIAEILGAPRIDPDLTGARAWAARQLGVEKTELASVEEDCSHIQLLLRGHVLAGWLETWSQQISMLGPGGESPEWHALDLGQQQQKSVPSHLTVYFPPGTLRDAGVAIHICDDDDDITVYAAPGQRDLAESVLAQFRSELRGSGNPYRGRILHATLKQYGEVKFTPLVPSTETRKDLIMPANVWAEIDVFLAAGTTRNKELKELGLSTNRGLLLAGHPGVGKTKMGRVIAAEVVGPLTVILADLDVLSNTSEVLYQEIEQLGPTLVVLEDIDGVAGKAGRKSKSFSEFLNALDGARTRSDILTLATTNDPESLDPAAKRPGRFDTILEVPLPTQAGREEILTLYLPASRREVIDIPALARQLDGLTGAELREVVRRGVLECGVENLTYAALLEIISRGRWRSESVGNYL